MPETNSTTSQPSRVTPERVSSLVAHYQRLQGLADWTFSVEVVPGLAHEGSDAWAVVLPDAASRSAHVKVRDIDATPIPGFDGDPMLEIRVTISHELWHCAVAEFVGAGQSIEAEEKLVEAAAQAVVRSESTGDARVMARSVRALPSALRARVSARAPRARGGQMDPKMVMEALEALIAGDSEKCAEILKGMVAQAAGGGAAAAPPPAGEPSAEEGRPAPTAGDAGSEPPAGDAKPSEPPAVGGRLARKGEVVDIETMRARKAAQDIAADMERMHKIALPSAKAGLISSARARLGADAISPATEKRILSAPSFEAAELILAIVEETPVATRARSGVEHGNAIPSAVAPKAEDAAKLAKEGFDETWIREYQEAVKRDPREGQATLEGGRAGLRNRRARLAESGGAA